MTKEDGERANILIFPFKLTLNTAPNKTSSLGKSVCKNRVRIRERVVQLVLAVVTSDV